MNSTQPNGNTARRDATDAIVVAYLAEQYEPVNVAQIHRDTGLALRTIRDSLECVGECVGVHKMPNAPGPAAPIWVGR